ncbi:MAG: hypothetical protein KDE22_17280 [Rhodobacterales bacterium]|nr:hypothetical protein [Rhodobacterales bacterium]
MAQGFGAPKVVARGRARLSDPNRESGTDSAPAAKATDAPPAPTPAPPRRAPVDPGAQSRALAETVLSSFMDRIKAEARRKGSLTVADLDALSDEFASKTKALQAALQQSFVEYGHARDRERLDFAGLSAFERMMVTPICHLFPNDEADLGPDSPYLSRAIVPGFLQSLSMLVGAETLDDYRKRAEGVAATLRQTGGGVDWSAFMTSGKVRRLSLIARSDIALQFHDLARRRSWLVNLLNTSLALSAGHQDPEHPRWEMTDARANRFLSALFADLRSALTKPDQSMVITDAHGPGSAEAIGALLNSLDADLRGA